MVGFMAPAGTESIHRTRQLDPQGGNGTLGVDPRGHLTHLARSTRRRFSLSSHGAYPLGDGKLQCDTDTVALIGIRFRPMARGKSYLVFVVAGNSRAKCLPANAHGMQTTIHS